MPKDHPKDKLHSAHGFLRIYFIFIRLIREAIRRHPRLEHLRIKKQKVLDNR